ncbi:MAG TPA: hypothetical protein EYH34_08850 [Planctomycetes bacterium]|nr:hypothetical protein [Planctomycetota bacterium]
MRLLRRHPFDVLLDAMRRLFPEEFIEATLRLFATVGTWGLYGAMALWLLFSVVVSLRSGSFFELWAGLLSVVLLVILEYAGRRFGRALDHLNRATSTHVASTAFLDCFALFGILIAVVGLIGLGWIAVRIEAYLWMFPAAMIFVVCLAAAIMAVNPDWLSVTVAPQTTPGQELVGIVSFLMKLGAGIVPVVFGAGVAWGTLELLYACFLAIAPPGEPPAGFAPQLSNGRGLIGLGELQGPAAPDTIRMLPALEVASRARTVLFLMAALPVLMYFAFLFYYLALDVLQAVLSLPLKLDRLATSEGRTEREADAEDDLPT